MSSIFLSTETNKMIQHQHESEFEKLKREIYSLYNPDIKINREKYNSLILQCVDRHEMTAVVFLYDHMLKNNIKPNDKTFKYIDRLHSKTVQENNKIPIKNDAGVRKLKPRRRIHKIMKGHNYSEKYNKALEGDNIEKVKKFITENPDVKYLDRGKLARTISRKCGINVVDARYIITNLKRTKFLVVEVREVDDFSQTEEILRKYDDANIDRVNPDSLSSQTQTRISDFFQVHSSKTQDQDQTIVKQRSSQKKISDFFGKSK